MIGVDEDQALAYLPLTSPTNDMLGGHRLGDSLFSSTLVCVTCLTGERVWHYQITHHDLFDYDLPTAPILADLVVDGKPIEAVIQLTKQAFAFVFDRTTGAPVWPIESGRCHRRRCAASVRRRRSRSRPGHRPSTVRDRPATT